MALPKIIYDPTGAAITDPTNPPSTAVTLTFKAGPQNFLPSAGPVVHDNIATSGLKERVIERIEMYICFDMPAMQISDDLPGWMAFMAWAFAGASFLFFPNAAMTDYYNCVDETTTGVAGSSSSGTWSPACVGPGRYSGSFCFRIVPDSHAPADIGVVLKRFYGITG